MAFNSLRLSQTPATVSSGEKSAVEGCHHQMFMQMDGKTKIRHLFQTKRFFEKKKKTKKENNSSNNNENANFLLTHILKCKKNKKRTFSLFCHFFRNICVHLLPFFRYVSLRLFHSTSPYPWSRHSSTTFYEFTKIQNAECMPPKSYIRGHVHTSPSKSIKIKISVEQVRMYSTKCENN